MNDLVVLSGAPEKQCRCPKVCSRFSIHIEHFLARLELLRSEENRSAILIGQTPH